AQRLVMYRALAELMQVTRAEINTVSGAAKIQDELTELANTGRLNDLFNEIDGAAKQAIMLQGQGRTKEAIDLYTRQVSFRIANELQPRIDQELKGERDEVTAESAGMAQVQLNARIASILLAALGVLGLGLLGSRLYRSVIRPLEQ